MTQYIGNVKFSSFQSVTLSSSKEENENYQFDSDVNFVFSGASDVDQIDIEFTLEGQTVQESVEELKDTVRKLASNSQENNGFTYKEYKGFISVEDVNFPQSASESNIIRGTVSGLFLPWPKFYPGQEPLDEGDYGYGEYSSDSYAYANI